MTPSGPTGRLVDRGASRAASSLVGALLLLGACMPGTSVNVHNATPETLVVIESQADAEASHRILPGDSQTVGSARAWSVGAADGAWRVELPPPGAAFESGTLYALGSRAFRFQVGPGRCVHALGPDQSPPVDRFVPQPEGYPLGPECRRERAGRSQTRSQAHASRGSRKTR